MEVIDPIIEQNLMDCMCNFQFNLPIDADEEYYPKLCIHGEYPDDCLFCLDDSFRTPPK